MISDAALDTACSRQEKKLNDGDRMGLITIRSLSATGASLNDTAIFRMADWSESHAFMIVLCIWYVSTSCAA